jgi:hypothetical protein
MVSPLMERRLPPPTNATTKTFIFVLNSDGVRVVPHEP